MTAWSEQHAPVLVIEDCEEDFTVIQQGLQPYQSSYPILHFSESQPVRHWLDQTAQPARLILLDLNLPGERGQALLSAFKNHPRHKTTPVVVLSSSQDPQDVTSCYLAGANSYHTKPLETLKFYQTMQTIADYWLHAAHSIKSYT